MNWDFIFQAALAVLGAALIVGGIVAYRGSARTGVRSLAAAGIASGAVMLAIVAMTVAVSSDGEAPDPVVEPAGSASGQGPSGAPAVGPGR